MSFSPVIAFTVSGSTPARVGYLRETLESWSKVRGIEGARLIFCCEPGIEDAVRMCCDVEHAGWAKRTDVFAWEHRLGVLANPRQALDLAFRYGDADFAVLAEEDLIVSPDVLDFFAWCQRYRDDPDVLGVTTYQHHEQPGGLAGVGPADWSRDDSWHFWVWGTWRDRWGSLIRDGWDSVYEENGGGPGQRGWDWKLRNTLVRGAGMRMIAPSLARSQHIGEHDGAHCRPQDFRRLLSPSFAGLDVPVQVYQEVR